jgi:hypothetical protein
MLLHNPQVGGSIPPSATNLNPEIPSKISRHRFPREVCHLPRVALA